MAKIEKIELSAKVREGSGKGGAHRLRAQGLIPAIVYGRHLEKPIQLAVDPLALKKAISTPKKLNTIMSLKLDKGEERTVMLKDYQTDIVHHDLMHADFLDVRMNEAVKVNVPLAFVGIPAGVADGGILATLRRELELWMMPESIPEKIEVDVTPMKIGHSMHVSDIKLPEGSRPTSQINFTIAGVVAPEKEEEVRPAAGAEGAAAAAPGAPGAAAAAPAAGGKEGEKKEGAAAAPAKAEAKKK